MKKFSFLLMFLIPAVCLGGSLQKQINNSWEWSSSIEGSQDPAWQIYIDTNTTERKTIYIKSLALSCDKGGYFTIRSTNVGTGFTGNKTSGTPSPSRGSSGAVSISSVTTSTQASAATGDIIWQGIVGASRTVHALLPGHLWAIDPGNAIYVIKENVAGEKASVSFQFIESPR